MVLVINFFQPVPAHMGVNLSRGYLAVTEHGLDRSEVCSPLQQMGGKRMSENMGAYMFFKTCFLSIPFQNLPEALSGKRLPLLA